MVTFQAPFDIMDMQRLQQQQSQFNQQQIMQGLGQLAGAYKEKSNTSALDKAMGMAADEGLVTYDTLEKFTNLPWQQKAPVFDLWRTSMLPVQTNRMKVQDQAQIWGQYRGNEPTGPSAANRYGYVYRRPGGP
jgi:hypothetical protein